MREMHLYEKLPLFGTGLVLALAVIGISALLLAKPGEATRILKKFPRDHMAGQILLGIGMVWFWLLIAPDKLGFLSALAIDLGEFNGAKPFLRIAVPVTAILVYGLHADGAPNEDELAEIESQLFGLPRQNTAHRTI